MAKVGHQPLCTFAYITECRRSTKRNQMFLTLVFLGQSELGLHTCYKFLSCYFSPVVSASHSHCLFSFTEKKNRFLHFLTSRLCDTEQFGYISPAQTWRCFSVAPTTYDHIWECHPVPYKLTEILLLSSRLPEPYWRERKQMLWIYDLCFVSGSWSVFLSFRKDAAPPPPHTGMPFALNVSSFESEGV